MLRLQTVGGNNWYVGKDGSQDALKIGATPGGPGPGVNDFLTILNSGNVGIGTNSPNVGVILDLNGTGNMSSLLVPRGTSAERAVAAANGMIRYNTNLSKFEVYQANSWTQMMTGSGAAGDFMANGSVPMTGTFRLNDQWLSNDGGAEGIRVDNSGNVGIGTVNPTVPLQLGSGSDAFVSPAPLLYLSQANNPGIVLRDNGTNVEAYMYAWTTGHVYMGSGTNHDLRLDTNGATRMTIKANGIVGIGTSNPNAGAILDLNGTGNLSSLLLPRGTTAQRAATATNGMIRYNTNLAAFEVYANNQWATLATGSGGSSQWNNGAASSINYTSGNVGVGTTTPAGKLHIQGNSSSDPTLYTQTTGSNFNYVYQQSDAGGSTYQQTSAGGVNTYEFEYARSGWANVQNNDLLGRHRWVGYVSGGSGAAAQIQAEVEGTPSAGQVPGRLMFMTTPTGGGSPLERMRITNAGNVGIGTTNPSALLNVYSVATNDIVQESGNAAYFLQKANNGSTGYTQQAIGGTPYFVQTKVGAGWASVGNNSTIGAWDTTAWDGSSFLEISKIYSQIDGNISTGNAPSRLVFSTSSGAALSERMRIDKNGNIGIGTTSPSEKLHVVGNLRVQGSTDCTLGNGSGGTNCSSDIRLKTNVQEIEDPLAKILSLRGVEFDWNEKSQSPGQHSIGVIAQDVERQFPTAVIEDSSTGYKKVDYAVLVAPIIQAFKDLNKRIVELFSRTEEHSRDIATVNEKTSKLEADNQAKDQKIQNLENQNKALQQRLDDQQKELEAIKRKLGL